MPDALAPDSALPAAPLFAGAALLDAEKLDLLGVRGVVDDRLRKRAHALLVRVVQMLTRLAARMTVSSISQQ